MSGPVQFPRVFRFAPFEVDLITGELRKNGRKLRLQDKPFQVLVALVEQRGELVNRATLRQRLWPTDTFVDFDNGLNTAISKLREALSDSAEDHRYVETLPRRGYRFVAPVEELGRPPLAQRKELDIRRRAVEPDVVLIEITGKIIFGTECQQVEWLIADVLRQNVRKVVFDISGVTQIDSTGLGIIVVCAGELSEAGGELRVAGAKGMVEKVLKITNVYRILPLYPTAAAAVEEFNHVSGLDAAA